MSEQEYTPSISTLRAAYSECRPITADSTTEFDRAIDAIKREAAASVIETLLDEFDPSEITQERLDAYAQRIREGKNDA